MNFLEQLVSEYYQHRGYYVRVNVRALKRLQGGWDGELDVLAFHPQNNELIHVEPSWDSHKWDKREARFRKKFRYTKKMYEDILGLPINKLRQRAITGGTLKIPKNTDWGSIEVLTVPMFISEVKTYLLDKRPSEKVIPENLLCLRSMQFTIHY